MARAPKKSPRNRLDPLRSKKIEHQVERNEASKTMQMKERNKRAMKDSEKMMKGSRRRMG